MSTGSEKFEREFEAFLADEESRLAKLYRKLPQAEPDPRLDASVKAMAHRALNPQLVATPRAPAQRGPKLRWLTGLGAAAGVVLAAGIAFKMGPGMRADRDEHGAPATDVISVRAIDAPPPAPPLSPPAPNESAAAATPAPRAKPQSALKGTVEMAAKAASAVPSEPAAPANAAAAARAEEKTAAAPEPFPERDTSVEHGVSDDEAVERRPAMAEDARQNPQGREQAPMRKKEQAQLQDRLGFGEHLTGQRRAPRARDAAAAPPQQAPRKQDETALSTAPAGANAPAAAAKPFAPAPAPAAAGGALQAAGPARESAAPASSSDEAQQKTAPLSKDPNARLYPEHWLANIRTMLREQRRDEALRSLAEFRRLYPDYRLPDDLRDLK